MSLQEKFQITVPTKAEDGESWVSAESQRDLAGFARWNNGNATGVDGRKMNYMPAGMDIAHQEMAEQRNMRLTLAGCSDISCDTNPDALKQGFTKRSMKGTDDQYTGEHMDHFYGDAGGFVERNNYLDRE